MEEPLDDELDMRRVSKSQSKQQFLPLPTLLVFYKNNWVWVHRTSISYSCFPSYSLSYFAQDFYLTEPLFPLLQNGVYSQL